MSMNASATAVLEQPAELEERFFHGWRDVKRRLPNGDYVYLQLPLTPFDVLHPQEGDHIMIGFRHDTELHYFVSVLRDRYENDPSVLVLSDQGVYWDTPGLGHHSPDLSVIFHIDPTHTEWPSFHVAREGVRPVLLLEVVSPSTREVDTITKLEAYHRAEVPCYVIIDHEQGEDAPTPYVYRWTVERYEPVVPDEAGRLLLEPLGLLLGFANERLVLFEAETGVLLGDLRVVKKVMAAKDKELAAKSQQLAVQGEELEAERETRLAAEARAAEAERRVAEMEQRFRDLEERLQHRNGPNGKTAS